MTMNNDADDESKNICPICGNAIEGLCPLCGNAMEEPEECQHCDFKRREHLSIVDDT